MKGESTFIHVRNKTMISLIVIAAVVLFILIMFFSFVPIGLWISAMAAGVHVGIFSLVGMRLRRVVPSRIILPLVKATKAGLKLSVNQLEAHYLAGGNVDGVVNALIASERAGIDLSFEKAAAIDLAGRNVLEAVQMSVNPKVIETPNISAVAKDGIELLVKARVTVRTNLERLVGGAGESTIIARIGEGIVTTVGSAVSHKSVLENPDDISKLILAKGLDAGTAFEILSIDIADIDIGRNIGAHLQSLQAEADKNIAQAKAEGTSYTPASDAGIEDLLEGIIQTLESVKNDYVRGVPRNMIRLVLDPLTYGKARNYLDKSTNNANVDTAAEDFAIFHGVRVYSSINLPVTSEPAADSKTKTTTVHAIAMIEGAIAQPAVIYPYKEPEEIPLSNDYGVSMFFDYGTKTLTPDLIFWYGTSVTA